jgi:hypothetical protein
MAVIGQIPPLVKAAPLPKGKAPAVSKVPAGVKLNAAQQGALNFVKGIPQLQQAVPKGISGKAQGGVTTHGPGLLANIGNAAGAVVSDIPKEIQGKGAIVTAGRQLLGMAPGAAVSALSSFGANNKLLGPQPGSLVRANKAALATDIPKEAQGTGAVEKGIIAGGVGAGQIAKYLESKSPGANLPPGLQASGLSKQFLNTAGNAVADVPNLGAAVLPSAFFTGKALLSGDPKQITGMGKQVWDQLSSLKGWEAHPVINAVTAYGGLAGLSRAGQFATDAARLTDSASATRAPEHLIGNLYNPRPAPSRVPVVRLLENHNPVQALGQLRRTKSFDSVPGPAPNRISHLAQKRTTEELDAYENIRRMHQADALRQRLDAITKRKPSGRQTVTHLKDPTAPLLRTEIVGKDAVNPIIQGILTHPTPSRVAQDAHAYIDHIAAQPPERDPVLAAERQDTVDHLTRIVNNKRFMNNPAAIREAFTAARDFIKTQQTQLEPGLSSRGIFSADAQDHAKLVVHAKLYMGARWGRLPEAITPSASDPRVVAAGAAIKAARRNVDSAVSALGSARTPAEIAAKHAVVKEHSAALDSALTAQRGAYAAASHHEGLLSPDGTPLSDAEIVQHIKDTGAQTPGFITHKPIPAAQSYYSGTRFPTPGTQERTGEAFSRGLIDLSHEAVTHQHSRSLTQMDQHDRNLNIIRLGAIHKPTETGQKGYFDRSLSSRLRRLVVEFSERSPLLAC